LHYNGQYHAAREYHTAALAITCPLLGWVAQQATADFHTRQLAQQSLVQLQCDASNLLPKDLSGALNLVWALEQVLA
jgi:hypothetical protein